MPRRSPAQPPGSMVPAMPPAPPAAPRSKSLTALEQEMEAERIYVYSSPVPVQSVSVRSRRSSKKLLWIALLIGIPAGALWFVNLPYPVIRRPVARTAPVLLLPSYMSMDHNYRQAIELVEQADHLIASPTSPADIELGAATLHQAQEHLDNLPLWFLSEWSEYRYWWYNWRFSMSRFDTARARAGELEAMIFQETNAQRTLTDADQALKTARQQYQQATTPTERQTAIAPWQSALDQMAEIPTQTLAGRTAQQKRVGYRREFQDLVGLDVTSDRGNTMIGAAKQFAMQAAQFGQNPPHPVAEWEQVENLWKGAIERLEAIPPTDISGYAEAQKLLATYRANLGQISIRRQAEEQAVSTLHNAQTKIERLLASASSQDRDATISQLQSIINDLKQVPSGTTAYLEAQALLLSAQNRLNQMQ